MKCTSCNTDINPTWGHAIESNICPNCGQSIMDEFLKSSLAALKLVMLELAPYKKETDDWLLSNCGYIKTSSPELVNYVPEELLRSTAKISQKDDDYVAKRKAADKKFLEKKNKINYVDEHGENQQIEFESEAIQDQSITNSFFARANLPDTSKLVGRAEKIKAMAAKIKQAGSTHVPEDPEPNYEDDNEYEESYDSSSEFHSSGGGLNAAELAKLASISFESSDDDLLDPSGAPIAQRILNMANKERNNTSKSFDKDVQGLMKIRKRSEDDNIYSGLLGKKQ